MAPGTTWHWTVGAIQGSRSHQSCWHGVRLRINPGSQGKQGAGAENIPSLTLAFAYRSGLARLGERGRSPAA